MCNCMEDIEKRVKEELPLKNKEYAGIEIKSSSFANKFINFETGRVGIGIPLNIEWTHTTKKGKEINKSKEIVMTISYCPFCGEELK